MSLHEAIYEKHFGPIESQAHDTEESETEENAEPAESEQHNKGTWSLMKGALAYGTAWLLWTTEWMLDFAYNSLLAIIAFMSFMGVMYWCSSVMPPVAMLTVMIALMIVPGLLGVTWGSSD